jgi:DNA mismatch repair ATPase MutS
MSRDELKSFYRQRAIEHTAALESIKKKIRDVSNLRLLVAIAALVAFYYTFLVVTIAFAFVALTVVFFLLVRNHSVLFERKTYLENLISVNQNELLGLDGNFSAFDPGIGFIDGHHAYSHDLDIFGEGSLFQSMSRCYTVEGKKLMASRLSQPMREIDSITEWQQAVKELSANPEFLQEVQARAINMDELPSDRRQLSEWVTHAPFILSKKNISVLLFAWPALTIALLALSFFVDGVAKFFWISSIGQWIYLGFHLKRVNAFHQYISRKKNTVSKYANILMAIEAQQFQSPFLKQKVDNAKNAHVELTKLADLVGAFDARLNSMTNLVVNSLLMYDIQCVYRLERWQKMNAARLEVWLRTVDETEVAASFGTFAFNNPGFVYPLINTQRRLSAVNMAHPLIAEEERIANDFGMNASHSVVIITGANMAGKSTFLRTLGVNFVLALNGSPVCATAFDCPVLELRTGMRTADSLRDHQSYFYAELNRLKGIMDELKSGKQLLILLDEILKGTNSTDKQAGSIALVKQLKDFQAQVVIATHDLALGELAEEFPDRIRNFCFEPTITNDQLFFDYKLKPGIAEKMNATFLMKKMGIIPL